MQSWSGRDAAAWKEHRGNDSFSLQHQVWELYITVTRILYPFTIASQVTSKLEETNQ